MGNTPDLNYRAKHYFRQAEPRLNAEIAHERGRGTLHREGGACWSWPGLSGHDETRKLKLVMKLIPAPQGAIILPSPRPLKGASRGVAEVGRGAAPAGLVRRPSTRAAPGLRPGPLRGPARSWLTTWILRYRPSAYLSAICSCSRPTAQAQGLLTGKRGPVDLRKSRRVLARREAPAVILARGPRTP
jgi:hypothetical protein